MSEFLDLVSWPSALSFPTTAIRSLTLDTQIEVFGPFQLGDILAISASRQGGTTQASIYVTPDDLPRTKPLELGDRVFTVQLRGSVFKLWRVRYEYDRYISVQRANAFVIDVNVFRVGNVRQRSRGFGP